MLSSLGRRYMAGILAIRRKTQNNLEATALNNKSSLQTGSGSSTAKRSATRVTI